MQTASIDTAGAADRITETAAEGLGVWSCALGAYAAYFADLCRARGFADVYAANARFAVDSVGICTRAAADRQRWRGVATPTLHDA